MEAPTTVGSLFRVGDAFGIEKLVLTGTTPAPPDKKISRTSRSTDRRVAHEYHADAATVLPALRADGFALIALELTTASVDLRSIDYSRFGKICLIVGAENRGIKPSLLAAAEHTIHIPMRGANSSMNVAVACAIALFEMTRALQR